MVRFFIIAAALVWAVLIPQQGFADFSEPRARHVDDTAKLNVSPLALEGGSALTVISPDQWAPLSNTISETLQSTHRMYTELFGPIPSFETSVRLMDEETFFLSTGAPRWTNALFYRNQIIIPMPVSGTIDTDNVLRSTRHEYTHAIIHALTDGRCPGWLDEGLAQWAEGTENPALRPALARHLQRSNPLPLSLLQGGFTKLDREIVAAAYAQSLIATRAVIDTFGFHAMQIYFTSLREGEERENSFRRGFGINETIFEERLDTKLHHWSRTYNDRPAEAPVVQRTGHSVASGERAGFGARK